MGEIPCPFAFSDKRQTNILVCRFFVTMGKSEKQQHILAFILLSLTAIVWGAGFLFSDSLLINGFGDVPLTLNTIRFTFGAIVLIAIFARKIRFSKKLFLFGAIGGAMLCAGFSLQLVGLKYTTPASCGFFTATYSIFVPFLAWIVYKKRPSWLQLLGVFVALAGIVVLNVQAEVTTFDKNVLLGNVLTFLGSMFFAVQIVYSDYVLHKKQIETVGFTVVQVSVCAILMAVLALAIESRQYSTLHVNWGASWWQLLIVAVLGTAFAYFSQTFAQTRLSPTETSIILACESPIGAILSVSIGIEPFTWQVCVGGLLVLLSIVIIEILPKVVVKKRANEFSNEEFSDESAQVEKTDDSPDSEQQDDQ